MISSLWEILRHVCAYYLWSPQMSLWHAASHFHKNISPQAPMAGNDAEPADEDAAGFLTDVR